jgi:flagellar biosynthesis protein FlhB
MAEETDKESKTEDATEKRINDALAKGQIAFSREVPVLASLGCFAAFLALGGSDFGVSLSYLLGRVFEQAGQLPLDNSVDALSLFQSVMFGTASVLLPLFLLLMIAGIIAGAGQSEPRLVLDRITPKFSRISPSSGWKRIFGSHGMVEFLKALAKLGFASLVCWWLMVEPARRLLESMLQQPQIMLQNLAATTLRLLSGIIAVMTVIAAFDFFWSRFSWRKDLRMSRQEVKDEHKLSEGDPLMKARMRSIGRDRARRRMLSDVPSSTLIIANPTHFSVALSYDQSKDAAPLVIAKGQDLIALKIREIGAANSVPVFEQVELARGLYKSVKIGQTIPPAFYQAVAELIRTIYNVNPRSV